MRVARVDEGKGRLRAPRRSGGFTLLEIVIALAVLSIMVGAVMPVASMAFQSKAKRTTREELTELADAAVEYFRDLNVLPSGVADLINDPGLAEWNGPYLMTAYDDPLSGLTDSYVDAWSRPYQFNLPSASELQIVSGGEDGAFGTVTDLDVRLDVTSIRREKTLVLLETINQAVTSYNGQFLPDTPLPTSFGGMLSQLVATGFLPSTSEFALDAWGDGFVPVPQGMTPVVGVGSVNLLPGSAGGTTSPGAGTATTL